MALLGYMYCLGLGVGKSVDVALRSPEPVPRTNLCPTQECDL